MAFDLKEITRNIAGFQHKHLVFLWVFSTKSVRGSHCWGEVDRVPGALPNMDSSEYGQTKF